MEEKTLISALQICEIYSPIINSYLSDFFIYDHWQKIPLLWRKLLLDLQPDELATLLSLNVWKSSKIWPLSLLAFRKAIHSLSITYENWLHCHQYTNKTERCARDAKVSTIPSSLKDYSQFPGLEHCFRRNVKPKKQHEIIEMSKQIKHLSDICSCDNILDIGAGQGHLSRMLSFKYGLNVTTVEAVDFHNPKAIRLDNQTKLDIEKGRIYSKNEQNQHQNSGEFSQSHILSPIHITATINPGTPFTEFINSLSTNSMLSTKYIMTGLHACGDLTVTMLKMFVQYPEICGLASVGCCYMKLTTESNLTAEVAYPLSDFVKKQTNKDLSYEALEMACHSIPVYQQRLLEGNVQHLRTHSYRAALQEIVLSKDSTFVHGHVKATVKHTKSLNFQEYAEKALSKLNLNTNLTKEQLEKATDRVNDWKKVVAFYTLRLSLAPLIETIILLDRILFLKEHKVSCKLVPVFNPLFSPRNIMLIANKSK